MSDFQQQDFYELLGVPRTATQDEIKRAYRREITKYHPDRFVRGNAEQQAYAQLRSQRLTEAYAALSDFKRRSSYNSTLQGHPAARQPGQTPPPARDHQAELYDQAAAHLRAGHTLQAIGALRQLQQINPFYRDSADLLAQAEATLHSRERPAAAPPRNGRRTFLLAGSIGGLALAGVAAWALTQRRPTAPDPEQSAAQNAPALANTAAPVATAPVATAAPLAVATAEPTAAATREPTAAATREPTIAPTRPASPTAAPTTEPTVAATPTTTPIVLDQGRVLFVDDFSERGWADTQGRGWSVGYSSNRYRITVDARIGAIWSYRTLRLGSYTIAADVQIPRGEGGLLIAFVDENSYLSFLLNPQQTSYRLERRRGDTVEIITGGQSTAILSAGDASNRMAARIVGEAVQLLVNGELVAETTVAAIPSGSRFGLVAISGAGAAEALFDNLEIREAA